MHAPPGVPHNNTPRLVLFLLEMLAFPPQENTLAPLQATYIEYGIVT